VEELLLVMMNNENLKIEIHGHICCFTVDTENLSFKRAQAVYDYLVKNGIAIDRLSFKGFGSTMPIYPLPEKSEEERVANRRVEIFVREK
jgi:outer membrane protein OmpA-like peptidoglycan-associated protein